MILMAGRAAKPALPLGAFYPRNCALFGFAMFNATSEEQQICARDMIKWIEEGQLKPIVGRSFPLAFAAEAERFLEANTVGGAGTLKGKVVIVVD
jgi:NADPH2:quinone reductase